MEDVLYILLLLVWLGYSLYRGSKKRKPAAKEGSQPQKKSSSVIEDFLSNEFGIEPQEEEKEADQEPLPAGETQYTPVEEVNIPSVEEQFNKRFAGMSKSPFLSRELGDFKEEGMRALEPRERKVRSQIRKHNELKEFSLKKAVIYSEILNPPYI